MYSSWMTVLVDRDERVCRAGPPENCSNSIKKTILPQIWSSHSISTCLHHLESGGRDEEEDRIRAPLEDTKIGHFYNRLRLRSEGPGASGKFNLSGN